MKKSLKAGRDFSACGNDHMCIRACSLTHIRAYLDTHPEQGARSLWAGSIGVGESGVKVQKHTHFYSSHFLQTSMRTKELEEALTQTNTCKKSHTYKLKTDKTDNHLNQVYSKHKGSLIM